jgi:hypothetical protein
MADSQTTVLPCPFCGRTNVIIDQFSFDPESFAVSCEDAGCMAIGPEASTREEATKKWNACKRELADHG